MIAIHWSLHKEFFRALGSPTRFGIIQLLRQRPHHVAQIAARLGFEQSRVSHNLACLLHCGFVVWNWAGKNKVYRLNPQLVPVLAGIERHLLRYAAALESCGILRNEGAPGPTVSRTRRSRRKQPRLASRLERSPA